MADGTDFARPQGPAIEFEHPEWSQLGRRTSVLARTTAWLIVAVVLGLFWREVFEFLIVALSWRP